MENKKDIGKLFKDNLSQLDYSPSDMVWDKIETDLKKDKRKRRFFFWIFLFAILIIGTTCYSYYHFNSIQDEKNDEKITNSNTNNNQKNNNNLNNSNQNKNLNDNEENNNNLNNSNKKVILNNNNLNNSNNNKISNNTKENNNYSKKSIKKANSNNKNLNNSSLKINSNKNHNNKTNTRNKRNTTINSIESNNKNFNQNSKGSKIRNSNSKKKSLFSNSKTDRANASLSSKNNRNNSANFTKKQQRNRYNNTPDGIKSTKKKSAISKRNKNAIDKIENEKLSKNSTSNSNTVINLKDANQANLSEIDSCCSDENCVVTEIKTPKKPEKKKLPETKKDSVIEKKTKTVVFSPYAGFNNYKKMGSDNKYGNSEIINSPTKYGNIFGLKAKLMFSEKTGIQTGVGVNTYYYNTSVKKLNGNLETESIELNQESSALNTTFSNDDQVTFQHHLRYIEIPFEAYHYFNTRKLSHATSFGLSFYFPLKNQVNAYSNNVTKVNIGKSQAYLKQGYGVNLNYYLNYNITHKIQVFISPAAQFQFLGNFDYGQPTSYTFSISTGLNYKL